MSTKPTRPEVLEGMVEVDETARDYAEAHTPDLLLPPAHLSDKMESGLPKIVRGRIATQVKRPHVAATLSTIDNILWAELKRLEVIIASGQQLDEAEMRQFRYLSEIAHAQLKEVREQEKHEKLEELSQEELLKAVEEAKRVLQKG